MPKTDRAPEMTVAETLPYIQSSSARLTLAFAGPEMALAINSGYVGEFLAAAGTDQVAMHVRMGDGPVFFAPVGDETFRHVIMPMRG